MYEQCTGVDAAYFQEVFSILKENKEKSIDRTYLFELLNRVFDHEDDYKLVGIDANAGDENEV